MLKDWNFWCSIITAGVALIALFISCKQMALSNKQCLFERRLKAYMLVQGMMNLCREYLNGILTERNNGPEYSVGFIFANLTNNSYLESMAKAIEHPLQSPFHQDFLRRREELRKMAMECELIFKGKEAGGGTEILSEFMKRRWRLCTGIRSSLIKWKRQIINIV